MEWTIKEFAAKERVHERTVRRWIEKGDLPTRRTPGGGVRIITPAPGATAMLVMNAPRRPQ